MRLAIGLDSSEPFVLCRAIIVVSKKYLIKHNFKMKSASTQIAFRYRPQDSATGVSQSTATQLLSSYEPDNGALTKTQLNQLKIYAPKAKGGTMRSSLFEC